MNKLVITSGVSLLGVDSKKFRCHLRMKSCQFPSMGMNFFPLNGLTVLSTGTLSVSLEFKRTFHNIFIYPNHFLLKNKVKPIKFVQLLLYK